MPTEFHADVVIMGGGIAGLWTLNRLRAAGYQAVMMEANALGSGQTRYAQGIVHGGTKYALTGKLTASSEAVSGMPAVWRSCLAGTGEVDLTGAQLISEAHYLWSTAGLASKVTGFFASKVMRARTRVLDEQELPELFRTPQFKGSIVALDEPVFDTLSVVRALAEPQMHTIIAYDDDTLKARPGSLTFEDIAGNAYRLDYSRLVLTAGQGTTELLTALGQSVPEMQLRPLKMVMMRGGLRHKVFAHCMGAGINPRVTITTHEDDNGELVWYVGGQLAEDGVSRSDEEQLAIAKQELADLLPWVDFSETRWATLDIDRAEVKRPDGSRPDTYYVETHGNVITASPTKLALAPLLARQVLKTVDAAGVGKTVEPLPVFPRAPYAVFPWCEESRWGQA